MTTPRFATVLVSLAVSLLLSSTARADAFGVVDNANVFSPAAVQQANDIATQIRRQHGFDLRVETYATPPADLVAQNGNAIGSRDYDLWIANTAQREQVRGIFILLIKSPGHIQIAVGNETQRRAFTTDDRAELSSRMLVPLRNHDFDQALLTGAQFVQQQMNAHLAGAAAPASVPPAYNARPFSPAPYAPSPFSPAPSPFGTAPMSAPVTSFSCIGVVFLIIIGLVIFRIIRAISYGARGIMGPTAFMPPTGAIYPPGGYYPTSGSGFGRGFFGGMLGGAVGSWAANQFENRLPFQGGGFHSPPSSGGFQDFGGPAMGGGSFGGSDITTGNSIGSDFGGGGGGMASGGGGNSSGGNF